MTVFLEVLLLAVSSNIDDLGTGLALSLKGYRLTLPFKLTVAAFSSAAMLSGLLIGARVAPWFAPAAASWISAAVFGLCAVWFAREALINAKTRRAGKAQTDTDNSLEGTHATQSINSDGNGLTRLHLSGLKPVGFRGGVVFGLSLGVDSFFLGIPAGLSGYPLFWTAAAAGVVSFLVLTVGAVWGTFAVRRIGLWADPLALLLLLALALFQLVP